MTEEQDDIGTGWRLADSVAQLVWMPGIYMPIQTIQCTFYMSIHFDHPQHLQCRSYNVVPMWIQHSLNGPIKRASEASGFKDDIVKID